MKYFAIFIFLLIVVAGKAFILVSVWMKWGEKRFAAVKENEASLGMLATWWRTYSFDGFAILIHYIWSSI